MITRTSANADRLIMLQGVENNQISCPHLKFHAAAMG